MTTSYEIPLLPTNQRFSVTLAGVDYEFAVSWNDPGSCWFLDIYSSSSVLIVGGICLVTRRDLLAQYAYLGIGGSLYVSSDHSPDALPGPDNLGSTSHLYFVVR